MKRFLRSLLPLLLFSTVVGSGYATYYFISSAEEEEIKQSAEIKVDTYSVLGDLSVSPEQLPLVIDQNGINPTLTGFTSFEATYTFPDSTSADSYNLLQWRFVLTIPSSLTDFFISNGATSTSEETNGDMDYIYTYSFTQKPNADSSPITTTQLFPLALRYKDSVQMETIDDFTALWEALEKGSTFYLHVYVEYSN